MNFLYNLLKIDKKISSSSSKVYTPNKSCQTFMRKEGYVSKIQPNFFALRELEILKFIKRIDKDENHFVSFVSSCPYNKKKYNIISKYHGIAMDSKKYIKLIKDNNITITHFKKVFLKQMLKSIDLLHEKKLFHRNIITSNILYDEKNNKYRLIDFGDAIRQKDITTLLAKTNIRKTEKLLLNFLKMDARKYSLNDDELIKILMLYLLYNNKHNIFKFGDNKGKYKVGYKLLKPIIQFIDNIKEDTSIDEFFKNKDLKNLIKTELPKIQKTLDYISVIDIYLTILKKYYNISPYEIKMYNNILDKVYLHIDNPDKIKKIVKEFIYTK